MQSAIEEKSLEKRRLEQSRDPKTPATNAELASCDISPTCMGEGWINPTEKVEFSAVPLLGSRCQPHTEPMACDIPQFMLPRGSKVLCFLAFRKISPLFDGAVLVVQQGRCLALRLFPIASPRLLVYWFLSRSEVEARLRIVFR